MPDWTFLVLGLYCISFSHEAYWSLILKKVCFMVERLETVFWLLQVSNAIRLVLICRCIVYMEAVSLNRLSTNRAHHASLLLEDESMTQVKWVVYLIFNGFENTAVFSNTCIQCRKTILKEMLSIWKWEFESSVFLIRGIHSITSSRCNSYLCKLLSGPSVKVCLCVDGTCTHTTAWTRLTLIIWKNHPLFTETFLPYDFSYSLYPLWLTQLTKD